MNASDFHIKSLGPRKIKSPTGLSTTKGDRIFNFVRDTEKVLFNIEWDESGIIPLRVDGEKGFTEWIRFLRSGKCFLKIPMGLRI